MRVDGGEVGEQVCPEVGWSLGETWSGRLKGLPLTCRAWLGVDTLCHAALLLGGGLWGHC